ncbi:hypothetical protein ACH5RR_009572 [Cinchona calisaya]|uniref:Uncharacterized protein n=1 Tax=Cinchona calisaya TaxID=153742 RepID=A0ABD3AHU6_9GENT
MAEAESAYSEMGFFKSHLEGYKEFWCERFSFLDNYSRFIKNEKPLPSWCASNVEDFIASVPVHGPVLNTARDAVKYGAVGSVVEAVTTAGWAWKYSRSLHVSAKLILLRRSK